MATMACLSWECCSGGAVLESLQLNQLGAYPIPNLDSRKCLGQIAIFKFHLDLVSILAVSGSPS